MSGSEDITVWAQAQIDKGEQATLGLLQQLKRAPVAEAMAFSALIQNHSWTVARIAEHTGMTTRFVQQRLQLLTLPEPVLHDVASGSITFDAARTMAQAQRGPARSSAAGRVLFDVVLRPDTHSAGGQLLCIRRGDTVVDRYPLAPGALKALAAQISALAVLS